MVRDQSKTITALGSQLCVGLPSVYCQLYTGTLSGWVAVETCPLSVSLISPYAT